MFLSPGSGGADVAHGQPKYDEAWRWTHFTAETGLPSNAVDRVLESSDGTVWAMTPGGIAWFDDYRWHSVGVRGLTMEGRFREGVLANNHDSIFFASRASPIEFLWANTPMAFATSETTLIVVRGRALGVLHYDPSGRTSTVSHFPTPSPVEKLIYSNSGSIWLESGASLYRFRDTTWEIFLTSRYGDLIIGGGSARTHQLAEDGAGSGLLYVSRPHEMQGLWEWTGHRAPVRVAPTQEEFLVTLDVYADGRAIAVYRPNIVRVRWKGNWNNIDLGRIGIDEILCAQFRSNGDLLIGTSHGLYWYDGSPSPWRSVGPVKPDSRSSVNDVLLGRDGTTWLATGNGLEVYSADGRYQHLTKIGDTPLFTVTGLAEDRGGNIWISSGSGFAGVFRWDGRDWKHIPIGEDPSSVAIHKIKKDRKGNLWFLGVGMNPRILREGQPGAFLLADGGFIPWGKAEGILHGRVYSFTERSDGTLWFGTARGLSRWRPSAGAGLGEIPMPQQGVWTHWTSARGLPGERVYALAVNDSDQVWFGSWGEGGGLGFFDRLDSIHTVPRTSQLEFQFLYDLNVDDDNVLWVATDAGLYRSDGGDFLHYDTRSGLPIDKVFSLRPTDDHLFIGTLGGGLLSMDRKRPADPPPIITIEKTVVEDHRALIRWKPYSYHGRLKPSEIFSRYSLNGGRWTDWERLNAVEFDSLQPGPYRLTIQARGLVGQYDPAGATVSFEVHPPWYLRPVYYVPTLILVAGLIGTIALYLHRKRSSYRELLLNQNQLRMLASELATTEEKERRRMAGFLHDHVSQAIGFCSQKLSKLEADPGDPGAGSTIAELRRLLDETNRNVRTLTFELSPPILYDLGLEAALEWLCEEQGRHHGLDVSFEDEGGEKPLDSVVRGLLFSSARELIINAVKHARPRRIAVATKRCADRILIEVKDDGSGFDPAAVLTARMGSNGGFGLYSVRERLIHLGGSFEIESSPGGGTSVRLGAPLAESADGGGGAAHAG